MIRHAALLLVPALLMATEALRQPEVLIEYEIGPFYVARPRGGVETNAYSESVSFSNKDAYGDALGMPPIGFGRLNPNRSTSLQRKYRKKWKRAQQGRCYYYYRGDLATLMERAFGFNRAEVPKWFQKRHYEVYFETTNAKHNSRAILGALLIRHFEMSYRRERRPVGILVMRPIANGSNLRVSTKSSCSRSALPGELVLRFQGCRLADAAAFLERVLQKDITNEADSTVRYDFDVPVVETDVDSVAWMTRTALGTDLRVEIRPVDVVIVEDARRLKKRVRYRP